jgi:hypothetical protein
MAEAGFSDSPSFFENNEWSGGTEMGITSLLLIAWDEDCKHHRELCGTAEAYLEFASRVVTLMTQSSSSSIATVYNRYSVRTKILFQDYDGYSEKLYKLKYLRDMLGIDKPTSNMKANAWDVTFSTGDRSVQVRCSG